MGVLNGHWLGDIKQKNFLSQLWPPTWWDDNCVWLCWAMRTTACSCGLGWWSEETQEPAQGSGLWRPSPVTLEITGSEAGAQQPCSAVHTASHPHMAASSPLPPPTPQTPCPKFPKRTFPGPSFQAFYLCLWSSGEHGRGGQPRRKITSRKIHVNGGTDDKYLFLLPGESNTVIFNRLL